MKIRNVILLSLLILAVVAGGCSKDRTTTPVESNAANVSVRLEKTSLTARIDLMRLTVFQSESLITQATTTVVDGEFTFGGVVLEVGDYIFVVEGIDILPDDNQIVIYGGQSEVTIGSGSNPVTIDVRPVAPMVRIAPYEQLTAAAATFTSQLEIWNVPEFRSGQFTITLDPARMRFVNAIAANEDWGPLNIVSELIDNQLSLTVTRTGESDIVPNEEAILSLSFSAISAGVTYLAPATVTMTDDEGNIPGLATVYEEAQNVTIVGGGGGDRGVLTGHVTAATTGGPLVEAQVSITGPANRTTTTNSAGVYLFDELQYGTYEVTATISGYITLSRTIVHNSALTTSEFALTEQLAQGQFRIVLSWGETPTDLDAHFWTTVSEQVYEVYYGDQGVANEPPYVILDTDDQDGLGPETITMFQLSSTGVFAVKNYVGTPAITESNAQIEVYSTAGKIANFSVPTTGTGVWWYVFDISPQGVITTRNTISDTPPLPSQDGAPGMPAEKQLQ